MNPATFTLSPPSGWAAFSRSEELVRAIDDFFDRERSEDPWHHYGFTSDTSIWDSYESEVRNCVFVAYESYKSDKVTEVTFVITECPSVFYREIRTLKCRLIDEFQLEEAIDDSAET